MIYLLIGVVGAVIIALALLWLNATCDVEADDW